MFVCYKHFLSSSSSCPLPVWYGTLYSLGSLHIFLTFSIRKSQAQSFLLCMDLHFIVSSSLSNISIALRGSLHLCCFQLNLPFSFSPVHPRSCVAVWVVQVIMVKWCVISTETSPWSGTSSISACLHATVLIGGGIF